MTGCRVTCQKNMILVSKSCDLAIIDLLDSLLAEISERFGNISDHFMLSYII